MILSGNILQEISSKDTSISTINKIYKEIVEKYESESIILDFGCGKYDRNKEFAEKNGFRWYGIDPFNRTEEYNEFSRNAMKILTPDIIVCNNVINVIKENDIIMNVLGILYDFASDETDIYITIYEGDKSGIGKVTSKGYQRNQKRDEYKDFILEVFDVIDIVGSNILKCRKVEM